MFANRDLSLFRLALIVLGFILLGFGVFLATQLSPNAPVIAIGTILSGVFLLVDCCFRRCHSILLCLLLVVITLFLIISGILSLIGATIIGIIFISLGIISLLLSVICFVTSCHCRSHQE
ncbi:hypothetical protein [Orenia metallireducens]|uniref:hypothetical protein n=1 Tax=Orenia metallireducens TaxID=1413210 RepID=UPI000BE46CA7|nr:hypothetical protein [Orenia metallireducens]